MQFYTLASNKTNMKKIVCILLSILIMGTASFAQDKTAKKPAKKDAAKSAPAKKETPAKESADKKPSKMKKDGTPDMRAKENKAAKPAAGPMKKDGTPDMRYKANKDAAAKKDAPSKK